MFLMTSLTAVCGNSVQLGGEQLQQLLIRKKTSFCCVGLLTSHLRLRRLQAWHVPNANNGGGKGGEIRSGKKTPWWKQFLFDDDEDDEWLSMEEDGLIDDEEEEKEEDGMAIEERKFETWRRRAEAISELRVAQEDARNGDSRNWEDWLESSSSSNAPPTDNNGYWDEVGGGNDGGGDEDEDRYEMFPDTRLVNTARDLLLRTYDDELLFEDRVFRYASRNSAKFLGFLVIVPWIVDFVVHDFVVMPFLDRYVKTVPLATEFFDVKRDQKLQMIKALKSEKARYQFEVEIGKSPPLSDDEVWVEMRHKAIEMRDEWRLENRNAFANILSDMVYGITLFLLVYFNQSRVALLKFTGYKLLNNVTETGKAFLIILITDIFLGYHSASGWEALLETILERYGLEVDQAAITIFICIIPVVIDACVKLWLFKFLPKVSPNVTNIFKEMKRH